MNLSFLKGAAAATLVMLAFIIFRSEMQTTQIKQLSMQLDSTEFADTTSLSHPCACDDALRFDVSSPENSGNYPIDDIATCRNMVMGSGIRSGEQLVIDSASGAWFSKITLDIMFCHKPDANGIYVYKARDPEGQTVFLAEAARSNKIVTLDDGLSYIYYSKTLCPNICGVCATAEQGQ